MISKKDLPQGTLLKSINLLGRGSLSVGPKILWWLHRQRFAVERRWALVETNSRRALSHCRTGKASNLPRATAGQHYLRFAFVPKQGRIDQQTSSCEPNTKPSTRADRASL